MNNIQLYSLPTLLINTKQWWIFFFLNRSKVYGPTTSLTPMGGNIEYYQC